jgi:flagellin
MALGVLNNLSAIYAENNLNNTNASLQTVLQQLSSGSQINSGADDAAGLSLVNGLAANSAALTQSETNATEGVGLLQVADGALSQVTSLLNRAITLATEASNGTLNSVQESAANQEYQSIMAEVNNIGQTTTYNQEQVFGGKTEAIYTGDSSTEGSSIDDLNIRTLSESSVGDTDGAMAYSNGGSNVFINLSSGGNNASLTDSLGASTSTTTVDIGRMTSGADGSAVSATTTVSVGAGTNYKNTVQGLISAIDNSGLGLDATFTTAAQAGAAAEATALASTSGGGSISDTGIEITASGIGASGTNANGAGVVGYIAALTVSDTLGGTLSIIGSDGNTHVVSLGTANSTDTLANLASTINAADYGVTATVNSTTGALQFTTANSNVSVSAANLTENPTATIQPAIQVAGSTIGTITVANINDQLTGTLSMIEGADTLGTAGTLATLNNTTLAALKATINSNTAASGIVASLNAAAIGTLGQPGYQAIGTVMTLSKADAINNTAGPSNAPVVDLGTPSVSTTGIAVGALVNSTTVGVVAGSGGSLGSLSVAQAGDTLGSGTIDITDGAGNAANIVLNAAGQTLQTIANDINNVGGVGNYGDGIAAVLNSTNTGLTFYEEGTPTDTPVITAANLTDTTAAGTGTYTASVGYDGFGSGAGALGGLTVAGGTTDVLNGTLSITEPTGTVVPVTLTNQTLSELMATINGTAAYGITASLNPAGTTLLFTATSGDAVNPLISNTGNITDTTPAVATDLTMTDVPTPGLAPSTELGTVALSGTLTGSIAFGTLASNSITIGATDNTGATLASTIDAGNYGVTASYSNGTMTFSSANSAMTVGLTNLKAGGVAVGALQGTPVTSSAYYSIGVSSANGITDTSTHGGTSNIGITMDVSSTGGVATMSYTDDAGEALNTTDLGNQTDAEAALNDLNVAISDVAAQDGYIGAQINTLNSISQVMSTQKENVLSAQNAVQATDYASATSNMSKYEILSQTGIAALAQANQVQQEVTKLLQ